MQEWIDLAPAIIQGWYAGAEAGNVFADILFGDVNPSGKLPFTFPKRLEDTPAYQIGDMPGEGLEVSYKEGTLVGYRFFETKNIKPQFAFGHGLSYTSFDLSSPTLKNATFSDGETLTIQVKLTNMGRRSGSEVVQVYIEDLESTVERPKMELKAFKKIALKAGATRELSFDIDASMLAFYDVGRKAFYAEPGQFKVHIGTASDAIQHTCDFTYTGTTKP